MRGSAHSPLGAEEVTFRAKRGAVTVGLRGFAIRALGLVGYLVLARLLTPEDFGLLSLGFAVVFFSHFFVDAGIGAYLIGQPRAPSKHELRSVVSFQLAVAALFACASVGLAAAIGADAGVIAVMMASVPFVAMRAPTTILLERRLDYRPIVAIEVGEVLAYNAWAIGAVVAGFGVYGVASANVIRALVGLAIALWVGPVGLVRPSLGFSRVRPMLSFGWRVQGAQLMRLVRDQGVIAGTGAIAGLTTLGLWAVASRVLLVPYIVFESLWRVSYPAISRLLDAGADPRGTAERSIASGAVLMSLLLAPFAASSVAFVPALLGGSWTDAAWALPPACVGFAISQPIAAVAIGYLMAHGDARSPLRASSLQAVSAFAITLPLLPALGVVAPGVGWLGAGLVEGVVLSRALREHIDFHPLRVLFWPVASGIGAGALGWLLADGSPTVIAALAAATLTLMLQAGTLFLVRRAALLSALAMAASIIRALRSPTPADAPAESSPLVNR